MTFGLVHSFDSSRFLSSGGGPEGGSVFFYFSGTTDLAPIFIDESLTTPSPNPIFVPVAGILPNIFLDPSIEYRRKIVFLTDGSVQDKDPVVGRPRGVITSVTDAPFNAKLDGVADDSDAINAALSSLGSAGGTVSIPYGTAKITKPLVVKSNTTLIGGGWIKAYNTPATDPDYHAAVMTDPDAPANNIIISGLRIDGNGVAPLSGIIIRRNATEILVDNCVIVNCAHNTSTKGGRGLNIEVGTQSLEIPCNIVVNNLIVDGCYGGISCSGGSFQKQSNISISNFTISNCQVAVQFFGNSEGYPHNAGSMQYSISNGSIRNCGKDTTYSRTQGVFSSDRASNVLISNVYAFNDTSYGSVGSFWRGDAYNVSMSNCVFSGDCTSLLDFSSYSEKFSFPLAANSSSQSYFNVRHIGSTGEVISLPVSSASYFSGVRVDLSLDVVTSLKPSNSNLDNKTDCYGVFYNKTSNSIIEGPLSNIGSGTLFSTFSNGKFNANKGVIKCSGSATIAGGILTTSSANNCTVSRVSAGRYRVTPVVQPTDSSYVVNIAVSKSTGSDSSPEYTKNGNASFDVWSYNSAGVPTDCPQISWSASW